MQNCSLITNLYSFFQSVHHISRYLYFSTSLIFLHFSVMTVYIYILEQLCYMLILINLPCLTGVQTCLFLIKISHSCSRKHRYVDLSRTFHHQVLQLLILHLLSPLLPQGIICMYTRHNYQSWLLNFLNLLRNHGLGCHAEVEKSFFS